MNSAKCFAVFGTLALLALLPHRHAQPAPAKETDPDEQILREAHIATDAPNLLDYLAKRSAPGLPAKKLEPLLRQLASKKFATRKCAARQIVALGMGALAPLRKALAQRDLEVATRVKHCIKEIEKQSDATLAGEVIRLLLRRRPAGADGALLRYLPFARAEAIQEDIYYGLDALAARDGKTLTALAAALTDAAPARRAVAACILGRRGNADQRAAVRKVLADADALVRLRAAQGLLAGKDKAALPVLIALLGEPAVEVSWQAEELLHWVAGEEAPEAVVGAASAAERKKCRTAWQAWWRGPGKKLDLARLDREPRRPGLLLVGFWDYESPPRGSAESRVHYNWVCVYGCDGRPRWRLSCLPSFKDIQLLTDNRILLAESDQDCISERDLAGKVVWQTPSRHSSPVVCRRLENGNTFITSQDAVLEVTPREEVVNEYELANIWEFQKLPNGRIVYVTPEKAIREFDPLTGRKAKLIKLNGSDIYFILESLPDGHYLLTSHERVVEVDGTGRTIWQCLATDWGIRLRNSNTLLEGKHRLLEVDRAGKTLWEAPLAGEGIVRVRKCLNLVRFGFDHGPRPSVNFDSVSYRAKSLKSKNVLLRRLSARDLADLGPKARSVVPGLITALADSDVKVREAVKDALRNVGPAVLPALHRALKNQKACAREEAVIVLGRFGPLAGPAVPELIEALRDENRKVRAAAVYALVSQPEAKTIEKQLVAHLAADLKQVKRDVWFDAVDALTLLGKASKAARSALLAGLKHSSEDIQAHTAYALGDLSSARDERIVPALSKVLKSKELIPAHKAAFWALAMMGPRAKAAVPALLETIKSPAVNDPTYARYIRREAIYTLAAIGPEATAAVPALMEIFKNDIDGHMRQEAARALGSIGLSAKAAFPVLRAALRNVKDKEVWRSVCAGLGGLGPDAVAPLLEFIKTHKDDRSLIKAAIDALGCIGPAAKAAVPQLIEIWKDPKLSEIHKPCARALAEIGPGAKAAVPALVTALKANEIDGVYAAFALGRIAPKDQKVIAALSQVVRDEKYGEFNREGAARALSRMGPPAAAVVPVLVEALRSGRLPGHSSAEKIDPALFTELDQLFGEEKEWQAGHCGLNFRFWAIIALGRFGPRASKAVPALAGMLPNKKLDWLARGGAVWVLGKIGPAAKSAAPALLRVLKDVDEHAQIHTMVRAALARIGRPAVPGLVETLQAKEWSTRFLAVETLAAMGRPAKAALPALADLSKGKDLLLRRAATLAAAKIRR
jgi:HEAT repeat protein